jgi:glycosyltransferase involved in cell wall biosynthesis
MPDISVIIATFNSEGVLRHCLDSLQRQSFRSFEVIVVDGGSVDGTLAILNEFHRSGLPVSWTSEPDAGVYDAWNKGIERSVAPHILFIGSDDLLASNLALEKLSAAASEHPNAPFVYGQVLTRDHDAQTVGLQGEPWRDFDGFRQNFLFAQFPFPIMAALYRRDFIGARRFDLSYRVVADMDLVLRGLREWAGEPPSFLNEVVVVMSLGGISTAPSHFTRTLMESVRCRRENGLSVWNLGLGISAAKRMLSLAVIRIGGMAVYESAISKYRSLRRRIRGIN